MVISCLGAKPILQCCQPMPGDYAVFKYSQNSMLLGVSPFGQLLSCVSGYRIGGRSGSPATDPPQW